MKAVAAVIVVLAVGFARPALACSRYAPVPSLAEPAFEAPLAVTSTAIEMACADVDARARCTIDVRVRVVNGGTSAVTSTGVVHSGHLSALFADGVALARSPAPPPRDDEIRLREGWSLPIVLAPGESRTIALHAERTLDVFYPTYDPSCAREGIRSRHPLAARGDSGGTVELAYLVVGEDSPVDVHATSPPSWKADIVMSASDILAGGLVPDRAHFQGRRGVIFVGMTAPRSILWNGGAFAGAGWSFSPDSGARLRVGYEIAAPVWLLHSVAMESDLSRTLAVVPAIESITHGRAVLGVGAGLPIVVRPHAHAGARLQISAGYEWLTLRGVLDLYGNGPEASVFGEASF